MGTIVSPSVKQRSEHSNPVKNSSKTTVFPAPSKAPSIIISCKASFACDSFSQITTPLPAANPSALTTTG